MTLEKLERADIAQDRITEPDVTTYPRKTMPENEWMTITLLESSLSQRVRKSVITAYGTMTVSGTQDQQTYIIKEGRMLHVKQTEQQLKEALEQ